MLIRYRFARGAGYSILGSIAFALFKRKPAEIQKQLDESLARFMEFQKKLDEGHGPAGERSVRGR